MRIRDPVPFWIRDEQPGSYLPEFGKQFFGLKYLNSLMQIRDPGWKKIRIRDGKSSDPGSVTLVPDWCSAYLEQGESKCIDLVVGRAPCVESSVRWEEEKRNKKRNFFLGGGTKDLEPYTTLLAGTGCCVRTPRYA
jgi:hypothetical protein